MAFTKPGGAPGSDEPQPGFRLMNANRTGESFFKSLLPFNKVSNKELVFFAREFSILLNASVPMVETLNILTKQVTSGRLKEIVKSISNNIESGRLLSVSLAQYPEVFNNLFVSLVKTGEVSGTLDQALTYIADQQEKDYNLRRKVKSALTYPAFVITAMAGVLALLFTFVMPRMLQMLTETGATLPITTRILLAVTGFFTNFWWVLLLLIVIGFVSFRYFVSKPAGRLAWDKFKTRLPVVGPLVIKIYIERFARNFAVLAKGGVPVVTSLRVTAEAIGSSYYQKILLDAAEEVENGRSLAQALSGHPDEVPDLVTQMVEVGEQTSKMDEILIKIANFYERETEASIGAMTQLLEPIVMLVLGAVVAIIVSGILLPIYNLVTAQ